MEQTTGMTSILIVCALVLFIIFTKEKLGFLVRILSRGVIYGLLLFGINQALPYFGIAPLFGINPVTVLTTAILGFPGVFLLFAVSLI